MFTPREIKLCQRGVYLQFLCSLLAAPATLQVHVSSTARVSWFYKRIEFKPEDCVIISTTWLFNRFRAWKHDVTDFPKESVRAACGQHYANPSGEQKSLTLFVRQKLLKQVGGSQRLKGRDTPEGDSEYFLVIPGGLDVLAEAVRSLLVHCRSSSAAAELYAARTFWIACA